MNNQKLGVVCVQIACVCAIGVSSPATAQTTPAPITSVPAGLDTSSSVPKASIPGFSSLFTETVKDFGKLPSKDSLKWVGIGLAAAAALHPVDQSATRTMSVSSLDRTFRSGPTIGSAAVQMSGALATYAIGRATGSRTAATVGADLFQAQLMSQAITQAIKMSVQRTRPDGTQFSFPSGHASITFATATVLQRDLGWKAGIPAYGLAAFVAASRVQEKRHYLSDVAFGAAIGIMSGRTVTIGKGDGRFAVAPTAAPGGGGVSFTWVGQR